MPKILTTPRRAPSVTAMQKPARLDLAHLDDKAAPDLAALLDARGLWPAEIERRGGARQPTLSRTLRYGTQMTEASLHALAAAIHDTNKVTPAQVATTRRAYSKTVVTLNPYVREKVGR